MVGVSASSGSAHVASRIWLVTEHASDESAAELLRAGAAEVTLVQFDQAASASTGAETSPRAVVVVTSSRKGRALVDMAGQVCADGSDSMTVLICDRATPADVRDLLHAGVRGIVLREHMAQALLPAVAAVASGQVCVPTHGLVGSSGPVLSIREKQVIGLVAMGLMNVEIARRLFLAESTVKSHLSSAFAKLGVRSRNEAVELILNPSSGLGLGILSLDGAATPAGPEVADLH